MKVKVNPFEQESRLVDEYFMDWNKMYPKPYNKNTATPFTKTRIILMNGTEYESAWFLHNFARNCEDMEIKKAIAVVRRQEQQQQKRIHTCPGHLPDLFFPVPGRKQTCRCVPVIAFIGIAMKKVKPGTGYR